MGCIEGIVFVSLRYLEEWLNSVLLRMELVQGCIYAL